MAGLKTDSSYIFRMKIKSGVTIAYGHAVVGTATDDEVDLPGGTASLLALGFALEGGTGVADGSVLIDVAFRGPSLPAIAVSAIAAGNTVVTNSTTGKISAATTAGAILGKCNNNPAADGDRAWICA
jgi:hypothetical protein